METGSILYVHVVKKQYRSHVYKLKSNVMLPKVTKTQRHVPVCIKLNVMIDKFYISQGGRCFEKRNITIRVYIQQ